MEIISDLTNTIFTAVLLFLVITVVSSGLGIYLKFKGGKKIIESVMGNKDVKKIANEVIGEKKNKKSKSELIESIQKEKIFANNLFNKGEHKIYELLFTNIINRYKGKYRVNPQVSMGEFLGCYNKNIFLNHINSKRVDFLISDKTGKPIMVIEVQGIGHLKESKDIERNHIKQLLIKKSGIEFVEIFPENDIKEQLINRVFRFLDGVKNS